MEEQRRIMQGRNSRIESFDVSDLLADMDRHDLIAVKTLNDDIDGDDINNSTASAAFPFSTGGRLALQRRGVHHTTATLTRSKSRSIPVPQSSVPISHSLSSTTTTTVLPPPPQPMMMPQSDTGSGGGGSCSHGSTGSNAFLSSVMSPAAFGLLSHTPPYTGGASSYEQKHFGKRSRSGSMSGRLRSASDYLEEKGLLDGPTKGILKDLVIIGDEELHQALDQYEMGNPANLEEMIRSGALQNRLPQDLDILGDLDLDFLTMDENMGLRGLHNDENDDDDGDDDHHDHLQAHGETHNNDRGDDEDDDDFDHEDDTTNDIDHHDGDICDNWTRVATKLPESVLAARQLHQLHQLPHQRHNKVSPIYPDDGIGELEFNGDFESDPYITHSSSDRMHDGDLHLSYAASKHDTVVTSSPTDGGKLSDFERRLRSNSLFSALLNDPKPTTSNNTSIGMEVNGTSRYRTRSNSQAALGGVVQRVDDTEDDVDDAPSATQYGQWMGRRSPKGHGADGKFGNGGGINIRKDKSALLLAAASRADALSPSNRRSASPVESALTASMEAARLKREKALVQEQRKKDRLEKKEKKQEKKRLADDEEMEQHVPGSGKPRRLSDPLLQFSIDEHGNQHVERPDGWIGAYSPDSRRVRIGHFIGKRNHRVWTKSVKYDVRKNFADSRLRVKGRFVKKEEESLMRELMSLT